MRSRIYTSACPSVRPVFFFVIVNQPKPRSCRWDIRLDNMNFSPVSECLNNQWMKSYRCDRRFGSVTGRWVRHIRSEENQRFVKHRRTDRRNQNIVDATWRPEKEMEWGGKSMLILWGDTHTAHAHTPNSAYQAWRWFSSRDLREFVAMFCWRSSPARTASPDRSTCRPPASLPHTRASSRATPRRLTNSSIKHYLNIKIINKLNPTLWVTTPTRFTSAYTSRPSYFSEVPHKSPKPPKAPYPALITNF